jgi:hypothetical protein
VLLVLLLLLLPQSGHLPLSQDFLGLLQLSHPCLHLPLHPTAAAVREAAA